LHTQQIANVNTVTAYSRHSPYFGVGEQMRYIAAMKKPSEALPMTTVFGLRNELVSVLQRLSSFTLVSSGESRGWAIWNGYAKIYKTLGII
jgi:hypothetical protein